MEVLKHEGVLSIFEMSLKDKSALNVNKFTRNKLSDKHMSCSQKCKLVFAL